MNEIPEPKELPELGRWGPSQAKATTLLRRSFATKSPARLLADTEDRNKQLKKAVGSLDIVALGIGGTIGTGVFVIIGEAVGDTGPAIILAFVLAGLTALFSAFSYAELASAVPVSGSAYTYIYATLGELIAWIIGWDLILEYGLSVAAIASGWGAVPERPPRAHLRRRSAGRRSPPRPATGGGVQHALGRAGRRGDAAAALRGEGERPRQQLHGRLQGLSCSASSSSLAATAFDGGNLTPFSTGGFNGIVDAAALIFFAYIGFDAVSTASEEVKDPAARHAAGDHRLAADRRP